MNTLFQTLDSAIAYAMGWTIIHSFWQASLVALLMSLFHKYGNDKRATFRYAISVFSMASVFLISVMTFVLYYSTNIGTDELTGSVAFTQNQISANFENSFLSRLNLFFTNNLTHINIIWAIGVALFFIRFIFSYGYTKYLRRTAIFSNSEVLNDSLKRVRSHFLVNIMIEIAESSKIDVPLVIGHLKPLILFPVGIVNMLSTAEVEAIITHELAHIKRYDYLTNILLTLVEILFYFHPAVWWISANVKAERENCCDDIALSQNVDKVVYAKALVKLEEIKTNRYPALAMPFSSKKHQLINRIKRIMNMPHTQNDIKEKSIATVLLLSIFLLFNIPANSESTTPDSFVDRLTSIDSLKIEGKDEIILTVQEGKFKSLEVDKVIQEGEIVEKIAATVNRTSTDENSYILTMTDRPVLILENDKVKISGNGGAVYQSEDDDLAPRVLADTIPNIWEENEVSIFQKDGKTVELEKKDGKITRLKIDGKVIPESEYGNYEKELESNEFKYKFNDDNNVFKHFNDSMFSNSFGLLFDGENWREFGGNLNQFFDEDMLNKLKDMEGLRFDFEHLEDMDHLKGLEKLQELHGFQNMEGFGNLQETLEELGIKLDSTFKGMNFEFDNLDELDNFHFFKDFYDKEKNLFKEDKSGFKRGTVVDKIGSMLNKDGLLKEYKTNKIELSGKHLKINGEKMPQALFEKYKDIYQESTGAPLTKGSKMVFDVEGKPSKRKVRTF